MKITRQYIIEGVMLIDVLILHYIVAALVTTHCNSQMFHMGIRFLTYSTES